MERIFNREGRKEGREKGRKEGKKQEDEEIDWASTARSLREIGSQQLGER